MMVLCELIDNNFCKSVLKNIAMFLLISFITVKKKTAIKEHSTDKIML